jgi:hypothetical protein
MHFDQVQSGFFLNVVVSQRTLIVEFFIGKEKTRLVGWDSLLLLNLGFDELDTVGVFDIEGDGAVTSNIYENLHTFDLTPKI